MSKLTDQLQLSFTEADKKRNRIRILAAGVKSHFDHIPAVLEAKEGFMEATKRLKSARLAEAKPVERDLEEIEKLKGEVKTEDETLAAAALKAYIAGTFVKVKDERGRECVPVLRVKFIPLEDPGETDVPQRRK